MPDDIAFRVGNPMNVMPYLFPAILYVAKLFIDDKITSFIYFRIIKEDRTKIQWSYPVLPKDTITHDMIR